VLSNPQDSACTFEVTWYPPRKLSRTTYPSLIMVSSMRMIVDFEMLVRLCNSPTDAKRSSFSVRKIRSARCTASTGA